MIEPGEKILVQGEAKARKVDKDSPPRYELAWIFAKRGTLSLSDQKLAFEDWVIPLTDITQARLSNLRSSPVKGYSLTVTIKDGTVYTFGLLHNPDWLTQTALPIEIREEKVGYSTGSIVFRVVLLGFWAWSLWQWLSFFVPNVQGFVLRAELGVVWFLLCAIVLLWDTVGAASASQRKGQPVSRGARNALGILLKYFAVGIVGTVSAGSQTSIWIGGLTGFVVAIADTIFGTLVQYRFGLLDGLTRRGLITALFLGLMVYPMIGSIFGMLGGFGGIFVLCLSRMC